nr:hypothetical protein [uncultured Nocardioides sp.]
MTTSSAPPISARVARTASVGAGVTTSGPRADEGAPGARPDPARHARVRRALGHGRRQDPQHVGQGVGVPLGDDEDRGVRDGRDLGQARRVLDHAEGEAEVEVRLPHHLDQGVGGVARHQGHRAGVQHAVAQGALRSAPDGRRAREEPGARAVRVDDAVRTLDRRRVHHEPFRAELEEPGPPAAAVEGEQPGPGQRDPVEAGEVRGILGHHEAYVGTVEVARQLGSRHAGSDVDHHRADRPDGEVQLGVRVVGRQQGEDDLVHAQPAADQPSRGALDRLRHLGPGARRDAVGADEQERGVVGAFARQP